MGKNPRTKEKKLEHYWYIWYIYRYLYIYHESYKCFSVLKCQSPVQRIDAPGLVSLTVGLVLSVPAAGARSTPATGWDELVGTLTTWPASPASPASGSFPPERSSAWWRRKCCAGSTTTPWWRTLSGPQRAVSAVGSGVQKWPLLHRDRTI